MNILIVDDHEENCYLLKILLRGNGHDAYLASNGVEALEILKAGGINLIISDILMPVMDGFQLCRKVKTDDSLKNIPFIIYTATYTGSQDEVFALKIGADRFIEKPCDPKVFMNAVEEVMGASKHRSPSESVPPVQEEEALKLYSERLVRKLEQKMLQAESEIQARREAENALSESKARLIAAQRLAKMGDFTWDLETGEITWSDALYDLMGYDKSEIIDYNSVISKIHHPDDVAQINQWINDSIATGKGKLPPNEYRVIRKGGTILFVHTVGNIMQRPKQKPVIFATVQDITLSRQTEDSLRRSESRFRLFADTAPVGVVIADQEQNPIYISPKFVELFGYTLEDIPTVEKWFSLAYPDQALRNRIQEEWQASIDEARRAQSEIKPLEYPVTCKDGTIRETESRMSNSGDMYFVVFTDITARKLAEVEHEKLQAQLIQSQKMESVGRLAGGVAHDFNNILQSMMGYSEILLDGLPEEDEKREFVQEIAIGLQRAATLTRQLLTFARKQTISPIVLDLNDIVESMLKMLRRLIGEDIDLAWLPEAGLWPVKMDPGQIDQILANLCVNARDAIGGVGKVIIETGTAILDEAYCADHVGAVPGDFLLLSISDNGCGMGKETLDKIFEPFFTTKGLGEGTGLGLATVYGITKQNNGFIDVNSELGKGTTFKIYLPRHLGEVEELVVTSKAKPQSGHGETVLIVEDDDSLLNLAKRRLESLGYNVIAVNGSKKAIDIVNEHKTPIHLLITDVVMPEMNGNDLSKQLRILCPGIKILFMSGYTADVIVHRGILDEGVNLIHKPFSTESLAAKVREVLESK